jgi:hypothetical protein
MRLRKNSQTNNQKAVAFLTASLRSPIVWLCFLLVSLVFFIAGIGHFFRVQTIICTLDQQPCPTELHGYAGHLQGLPIFGYEYAQILNSKPYSLPLTIATVHKQLPSTILVDFHIPTLEYQIQSPDRKLSVTKSGTAYESPDLTAAFIVTTNLGADQFISAEKKIYQHIHSCISSLQTQLQQTNLLNTKVSWVDKDTITLIMDGEEQVVLLDCVDIEMQVAKLSILLRASEYQEKRTTIKEIDMRFELPVLRMLQ